MVKPISELVADFEHAAEAARSATAEVVEAAGGAVPYLSQVCAGLLVGAPGNLQTEQLADYSPEWYAAAGIRYSRCGQCPSYGGACVTEPQIVLDFGMQPLWRDGHIHLQRCDKWPTYEQVKRLNDSGVPLRLAARASEDIAIDNEDELRDFSQNPRGRILEIQGNDLPWKRTVMLRVLWNIFASRSRMWGRYVLSANLMQRGRDFHSKEAPDPFLDLEECLVLVIDMLPTITVPEWWRERIGTLIYERWAQELCTIVITDRDPLIDVYPTVRQVDPESLLIVTEEPEDR